jgi:hypothetical protein
MLPVRLLLALLSIGRSEAGKSDGHKVHIDKAKRTNLATSLSARAVRIDEAGSIRNAGTALSKSYGSVWLL